MRGLDSVMREHLWLTDRAGRHSTKHNQSAFARVAYVHAKMGRTQAAMQQGSQWEFCHCCFISVPAERSKPNQKQRKMTKVVELLSKCYLKKKM